MTYTHLTTDELATIYSVWKLDKKAYRVAPALHRSAETVYRIFKRDAFGLFAKDLHMHGQRHPNGYVERRGKAGQLGRDLKKPLSGLS